MHPDLYEASIFELQDGLTAGAFTSLDLCKAYLARIEEVNYQGAALHAVIETNPSVLEQASALDEERRSKVPRGPLHGIPLLLKDNIATVYEEGMNTTAGSYALLGSVVPRDAHIVTLLRAAGAIFLGKTNMCEWAHYRGSMPWGWSARGGQSICPYHPKGDPSGSSSGSASAIAVGLAAGASGTETNGSIICPSSRNNIVGVKPTVGLVSRAGVIPLSSTQDTPGPMCRSVTDAAILLSTISGPDPRDKRTLAQPESESRPDYLAVLRTDALKGARLGVPRELFDTEKSEMYEYFEETLDVLRKLGAEVVDNTELASTEEMKTSQAESIVFRMDFRADINEYLGELIHTPSDVRTLSDLIAYNIEHADVELIAPHYANQDKFIASETSRKDNSYYTALTESLRLGRAQGIDDALQKFHLDALVLPTEANVSTPAGMAGYPVISVPLGFMPDNVHAMPESPEPLYEDGPGFPFGLAFVGTAYSESKLLGYAFAFEQATKARLRKLALATAIPKTQLRHVLC
ncbi:amidase signature enzyme [Coniophora puteana RWD-64-598 SS2]|uniref:Amidase signature enzyme n=1 Tax=Coniophora puteana (strain RWD-64-598) TaxID=741705 RepID=A0A5M3MK04_CONPW|nr:amidase signature enzyme [Coniophora puteana RWD-64-598 SS2]EIW79347.1 amidase signature enzyme [Coniophora puteana RWD-64-598 SS2]